MGKRRNKGKACAYCGAVGQLTRDHVIPKVLFNGELPSNPRPPIVLACPTCNNEVKSKNDALIKDVLGADYQVYESGRGEAAFASLRKAVLENNSELSQAIKDARPIWVTVNGLMVPAYEMRIPLGRIEPTISTVVRGLSVYYAKRQLPLDTEFVVRRWYDARELDDTLVMFNVGNVPRQAIGDGTIFDCRYYVAPDDPVFSFWVLRFFGCAYFSVSTHAAGTAPAGTKPFRFDPATKPFQP